MCGRFTSTAESSKVGERFGAALPEGYRERYNVAPAQRVLTVIRDAEERHAELMRWGLVTESVAEFFTGDDVTIRFTAERWSSWD